MKQQLFREEILTMTNHRPFAIVTGASSGIGYELAKQCAQNGFDLLIKKRIKRAAKLCVSQRVLTKADLPTRKESTMHHQLSAEMQQCIDNCLTCHRVCLREAMNHCLERGGRHTEPAHLRLMINCAEICQTSANFMLSGSALHARVCGVCAEVCEACAQSCEEVGEMDECVQACRRCAASCRQMAQGMH